MLSQAVVGHNHVQAISSTIGDHPSEVRQEMTTWPHPISRLQECKLKHGWTRTTTKKTQNNSMARRQKENI